MKGGRDTRRGVNHYWIEKQEGCKDLAEGTKQESLIRNRYFSGKLLTAEDFQVEQDYYLSKQRLINRLLHGNGVISGLKVSRIVGRGRSRGCSCSICITEGLALDGHGREIIVPQSAALDLNLVLKPEEVRGKRDLFIWISYCETLIDPIPILGEQGATEGSGFSRVMEGFKIEAGWEPPAPSDDGVVLARVIIMAKAGKIVISDIDDSAAFNGVILRKEICSNQDLCERLKHLIEKK